MHAHILFHKLKYVTEAKDALTAFHEDLKWYLTTLEIKTQQRIPHLFYVFVNKFLLTRPADYIDFPEKTLGFFFCWLGFWASSSAPHCVWHLAILSWAWRIQPACVSLWPWSGCTKFGASLCWSHWDFMDQRTKTMSSLKRCKELEGGGLILSWISSTSNILIME